MAGKLSGAGAAALAAALGLASAVQAAPRAEAVQPVAARSEARQAARDASRWLDDAAITTKVKTLLITDRTVDGSRINVDTRDGRVTLYGTVASPGSARRAAQLAKTVDGVQGVDSRLRTLNP